MASARVTGVYRITTGDGRSTEELVEAGNYGYAHSCATSENFPARQLAKRPVREIVFLEFDRDVTSVEAIAGAGRHGLEQPMYEDALYFGAEHPDRSVRGRWSSFIIPGSVTLAAATFSVSGVTPVAGSSGWTISMTRGAPPTASRSLERQTPRTLGPGHRPSLIS